ncbi:post-GPI attachment to proteins factor 3-like [Lytechinus pictus]|uniref:post-GPI attachment to proteins factor 3-like n=1 Tax=Lytechinus pictus TaxID=7653 RepID=UPI0030B9D2E0
MKPTWKTYPYIIILILGSILCLLQEVIASEGDRHKVHRNLLRACLNQNCSTPEQLNHFHGDQPLVLWMLGWDCKHECRYLSMWTTVSHLIREGTPISSIPQFYGKWPFIRILGVQEPASVIFSIANGFAQVFNIFQLRKKVPNTAPMYYVGLAQGMIAVNAWIWSTVFHSRDLAWTEKMDYYCAYSLVLSGLTATLLRIFAVRDNGMNMKVAVGIAAVTSLFYLRHVCFLALIRFDYGYNMKVNITTAILNFILIVAWSLWNIKQQPYLWKAIASVVTINLCLLLEVLDFPPLWWTFDAHSLWHASTIPIAFLYSSYFIDDCLYLDNAKIKFRKEA